MTTPTREQVIQWAKAAGFGAYGLGLIEDGAAPEVTNLCAIAMAYARAQALDEAAGVCRAQAERFMQGSPLEGNKPYAAHECASAIQALKGKR